MKDIVKKATRVIAFDDGFFSRDSYNVLLVGVVYRIDGLIEGVLSGYIKKDGLDVTEKIIDLIKNSRFYDQISAIMLSGINFAGFNIADIKRIYNELNLPVLVIIKKKPNFTKIFSALKKFPDFNLRRRLFKNAGKIYLLNGFYFQVVGTTKEKATILLKRTIINSRLPEPIRLSHIIASGISSGESKR
ncbi:MAG: DUF99 family protein [Candidatus Diapherotrites archaeon]|nr:DUF99 family protein [Candidatus Diapherotrites archaeon]